MVETNNIRIRYNKLYSEMRKYTWSFDVITSLSELEVLCYTAIPDISEITHQFRVLKTQVSHVLVKDDDLTETFDKFEDTLNNCEDGIYMQLTQVQEVMPV